MPLSSSARARSIVHPFLDFWLLGGASVGIWLIMKGSELLRADNAPIGQRFMQIGVAFSLLTLICNHPHFMMSYQFGYGRGFRFIRQHWFALVLVPLLLFVLFLTSFLTSEAAPASGWIVDAPNFLLGRLGVGFRFGMQSNLGNELMGIAIWTMYLTVGWHYSKQVFGAMMVYGHFDAYRTSRIQKMLLKGSVFSVAILQFAYLYRVQISRGAEPGLLPGAQSQLTPLGLPESLYRLSIVATILFFTASIVYVFAANFRKTRRLPSANFLIPWIALHIWWIPFFQIPEFTFLMVPFFHSLQYLPFAYRVGTPRVAANRWYYLKITAHAVGILVVGFLAFEGLPSLLDKTLGTTESRQPMFFITAFAVFINIHHFFIDSVTWRFGDKTMRMALLDQHTPQTFGEAESVPNWNAGASVLEDRTTTRILSQKEI